MNEGAEAERRQRLIKLGSAAAFLAIVAVAVLIVVSSGNQGGEASEVEGGEEIRRQLAGIPQQGMVLGDPRARVTLIEYGDLQCPACKVYAEQVVPPLIDSKVRGGEARLAFRSFTIIDEDSVDAAAAAIAAGQQGRGWDFVELFYRNQGVEASGYVTDEFLTAVAEAAGVRDLEGWDEARRSEPVLEQVARETAEAEELGLTGTPSFVVEGPRVEGERRVLGTPGGAGPLEEAIETAG